jgi:hypothetical protein
MIGRNLTWRLENLEDRVQPGAEQTLIIDEFVDRSRRVVDPVLGAIYLHRIDVAVARQRLRHGESADACLKLATPRLPQGGKAKTMAWLPASPSAGG